MDHSLLFGHVAVGGIAAIAISLASSDCRAAFISLAVPFGSKVGLFGKASLRNPVAYLAAALV